MDRYSSSLPDQNENYLADVLKTHGNRWEVGQEASGLLRAAEVALGEQDVAKLHERTEGWAAGLYLAALYLREGDSSGDAAASFGGDDLFVSEYVESEFLARISQPQRVFFDPDRGAGADVRAAVRCGA